MPAHEGPDWPGYLQLPALQRVTSVEEQLEQLFGSAHSKNRFKYWIVYLCIFLMGFLYLCMIDCFASWQRAGCWLGLCKFHSQTSDCKTDSDDHNAHTHRWKSYWCIHCVLYYSHSHKKWKLKVSMSSYMLNLLAGKDRLYIMSIVQKNPLQNFDSHILNNHRLIHYILYL